MLVQEIMSCDVELTNPNTSICDAARKMRDNDIGALPVGENDRLVGMITDRDIAVRGVAENCTPQNTSVREIMSERVCYCFDDQDIEDAAQIMADNQVRRLPVLNRDKRLVGVIALADISLCEDETGQIALAGVSEPTLGSRRLH